MKLVKRVACAALLSTILTACGKTGNQHGASTAIANSTGMPELAINLGCTTCHAINHKSIGPAWQDVANRYRGVATFHFHGAEHSLEDGLTLKVSQGGSGNWGAVPMIAADPDGVRQAELRELVRFILGLAK